MLGLYYDCCIQFSVTVNLFGSLNLEGVTPAVFYNERAVEVNHRLQTVQRKHDPIIQYTGAGLHRLQALHREHSRTSQAAAQTP